MVSVLVLTEAPVEALPRPLLVSALSARFWAAFEVAVRVEVLVLVLVPVLVLVVLGAVVSPVELNTAVVPAGMTELPLPVEPLAVVVEDSTL